MTKYYELLLTLSHLACGTKAARQCVSQGGHGHGSNVRFFVFFCFVYHLTFVHSVDVKETVAMLSAFHATLKACFVPPHIVLQLLHQVRLHPLTIPSHHYNRSSSQ